MQFRSIVLAFLDDPEATAIQYRSSGKQTMQVAERNAGPDSGEFDPAGVASIGEAGLWGDSADEGEYLFEEPEDAADENQPAARSAAFGVAYGTRVRQKNQKKLSPKQATRQFRLRMASGMIGLGVLFGLIAKFIVLPSSSRPDFAAVLLLLAGLLMLGGSAMAFVNIEAEPAQAGAKLALPLVVGAVCLYHGGFLLKKVVEVEYRNMGRRRALSSLSSSRAESDPASGFSSGSDPATDRSTPARSSRSGFRSGSRTSTPPPDAFDHPIDEIRRELEARHEQNKQSSDQMELATRQAFERAIREVENSESKSHQSAGSNSPENPFQEESPFQGENPFQEERPAPNRGQSRPELPSPEQLLQSTRPRNANPGEVATTENLKAGTEIWILWGRLWYPGEVVEVQPDGKYLIHYDGYPESFDQSKLLKELRVRESPSPGPEDPPGKPAACSPFQRSPASGLPTRFTFQPGACLS